MSGLGPEPYPGHDATGATRGACRPDRPCPACRAALPDVDLPGVDAWCQALIDRAGPDIVQATADATLDADIPEGITLEAFIRDSLITTYSQFFAEAMKAELGDFIPSTTEEIAANLAAELRTSLTEPTPGDTRESDR